MEVQGIKGLETIFLLKLRVMNPDEELLEISGLKCELHINNKSFASGVSNEHVIVPASGTAIIPVTVYTDILDLTGAVIELLQDNVQHSGPPAKPMRYELSGTVLLGDKEHAFPFRLIGSLPPEKQDNRTL